ncbi:uncharacterized protein LOC135495086 [Lineus longissimus]|uniref:uncharacterized protein LOC135495086 n=1 Tax=Lineus longissimus TaxID=88925 RepID=UPI00315D5677
MSVPHGILAQTTDANCIKATSLLISALLIKETMDAEKGYSKVQSRKKPSVTWNRVFVVIVSIVAVVGLCNFSLGMILWIEVKDLRRLALQEGKISSTNSMQAKGLQLNTNVSFTEWLNEQHQSGRYSLPSPIKDLLHETHRRYRRSKTTCHKQRCDHLPKKRRDACRHRCSTENDIKGRLDKVEKEVEALKKQLSTPAQVTRTKYEDRLGHFEGGSGPNNKNCKNKFLSTRETYLKTTADGKICMWQYASWVTNGAKQLYVLNTADGTVRVTEGGVYFIYGQLIVNDIGPRVAQGLWVYDASGNRKELARCVETARSDGTNKTFRTCYFGIMARIENGSKVYLAINTAPLDIAVRIYHTDKTAFFGLIKFTGSDT